MLLSKSPACGKKSHIEGLLSPTIYSTQLGGSGSPDPARDYKTPDSAATGIFDLNPLDPEPS